MCKFYASVDRIIFQLAKWYCNITFFTRAIFYIYVVAFYNIMNVNAIFYECNLPFSLQKFLFDVINKLWYNMIDIVASFLERSSWHKNNMEAF